MVRASATVRPLRCAVNCCVLMVSLLTYGPPSAYCETFDVTCYHLEGQLIAKEKDTVTVRVWLGIGLDATQRADIGLRGFSGDSHPYLRLLTLTQAAGSAGTLRVDKLAIFSDPGHAEFSADIDPVVVNKAAKAFLVLSFARGGATTAISPFLAIPREADGTLDLQTNTLHVTVPEPPPVCRNIVVRRRTFCRGSCHLFGRRLCCR